VLPPNDIMFSMKKELIEIEKMLKKNKSLLAKRFRIKEIGIFGSRIKGKERENSDVDILVEFYEVISLLDFVALERGLSELIGEKVDLVMKSALKPRIGKHILREVIYI